MDKVWLKNYPAGVPATINLDPYESLVTMFTENCKKFADRPAFTNLNSTLTFEETYQKATAFAAFLQKRFNIKTEDRVAIILPNLLQYPIAIFGILMAGGVVVNVNPLYTTAEMLHQLKDADVSAVIVLKNFAHVLGEVLKEYPIKNVIVTEIGDCCGWLKGKLINGYLQYVKKMIPSYDIPQAVSFNQVLADGAHYAFQPVPLNHENIAFLQYTGGTTGIAKGAILTHKNMLANVLQVFLWTKQEIDFGKEIIVTALPIYHIFCLEANILTFMCMGLENLLITNPRDIKGFIKTIKNAKFSIMTGVNTLFNAMVLHPDFKKVDFSRFKIALGGGMAVQRVVSDRWEAITKHCLISGYGLTESSPVIAIHPTTIHHFMDAVGLPVPSTEVKIVDEAGKECGFNESGELLARGPQAMRGYWRREKETAQVLSADGWLATGDIAKVDEEGFLYILERKKDLIIVSGFNVYPNEVEGIIAELVEVAEVAVIGVIDEHSGERVKAVIVKKDPSLTAEKVIAHCHEKLTRYKVPKIIEFVDNLPKTNVGKIMRRALR